MWKIYADKKLIFHWHQLLKVSVYDKAFSSKLSLQNKMKELLMCHLKWFYSTATSSLPSIHFKIHRTHIIPIQDEFQLCTWNYRCLEISITTLEASKRLSVFKTHHHKEQRLYIYCTNVPREMKFKVVSN